MGEQQRDLWAPFDARERTLGTEATLLVSHRPAPPRIALTLPHPSAPGADDDADSTACFLSRSEAARASGSPGARALDDLRVEPYPREDIRVIETIGQGGMGVIFKALQSSFGREIALKRAASDDPELLAQFVSEARITGALEHANIVPVYALRVAHGAPPELAMKLIRGTSWRDLLHTSAGAELDLEAHLRILISVCNAVSYAHQQGIIHRDLKPENVMTDVFGQVFVVDWGISAGLDSGACAARDMLYVGDAWRPAGTPSYMAPELALGDSAKQGRRTDVYLLGSCLHEVVTRRRRHDGQSVRSVLERAVASAPFAYEPSVPWELAEICNKATAADPEDRYPDVESFRLAIEGYLRHREAHAVAAKGLDLVDLLRSSLARAGSLTGDHDREIHVHFAEAQFALEHALGIWDGVREAREGLREASRLMLEYALTTEDVKLAARLADDAEGRARVEVLERELAARARELEALRSKARRLDWAATSSPIGTAYIAGGLIGSATMLSTRCILDHEIPNGLVIAAALWCLSALSIGAVALLLLRRAQVPDSLVSPRMLGTWGAVALGGLAVGALNDLRPTPLAHDMSYCALMVGIGFAAMAFQTRLWLLAPSALFFGGAAVAAFLPDRGFEVMSALWLLGMVGVGVALKMGATLHDPHPKEGSSSSP